MAAKVAVSTGGWGRFRARCGARDARVTHRRRRGPRGHRMRCVAPRVRPNPRTLSGGARPRTPAASRAHPRDRCAEGTAAPRRGCRTPPPGLSPTDRSRAARGGRGDRRVPGTSPSRAGEAGPQPPAPRRVRALSDRPRLLALSRMQRCEISSSAAQRSGICAATPLVGRARGAPWRSSASRARHPWPAHRPRASPPWRGMSSRGARATATSPASAPLPCTSSPGISATRRGRRCRRSGSSSASRCPDRNPTRWCCRSRAPRPTGTPSATPSRRRSPRS